MKLLTLTLTLALTLALLTACGKKGAPSSPGPENEIITSKQYPSR